MNLKRTALPVLFLLLANIAFCEEQTPTDPNTPPSNSEQKPEDPNANKGDAANTEGATADGEAPKKKAPETPKCHLALMKDFGFEGVEQSVKEKLDLCPIGNFSCCTIEDQLTIIDFWVDKKGEENMKAKLKKHEEVIIINKLILIQRFTLNLWMKQQKSKM